MRAPYPRFLLSTLFAAIALFLAACGQPVASDAKILLLGNSAEPQDLDPQIVTGVPEHHIIMALLEGLVTDHPSGVGVAPGVAERWETSTDGLTWTFHLRTAARWSNGEPVTARDFVRSYQRFLTPSIAGQYAYFLYHVTGAEEFNKGTLTDFTKTGFQAPDDHTLVLRLRAPVPFLLESLKHYAWFPVHIPTIEKFGGLASPSSNWTRPGNFVGNGAFVLSEWKPGQHILVSKSPTHWNTAATRLDGVKFFPIDNTETEERMFRTGQLHVTSNLPLSKLKVYREQYPDEFRSDPYYGTSFLRANLARPPLDDLRVRRALALAIDREAYVKVLDGGQEPALNMTPASPAFQPRARLAPDVAEARRLLAEAGYPEGKNLPPVELLYATSNSGKQLAEVLQQMWRTALGIQVTLRNEEWKVYLASIESGSYTLARGGWIGDYPDPHSFLDMWVTGGGNNQTGYSNPDYDSLLASALSAPTEEARMEIYQQLEAFVVRDLPVIPINFYKTIRAVSPRVKGWGPNLLDNRAYQFLDLAD
jgi:oligopeptide transport system substrate-binding protein